MVIYNNLKKKKKNRRRFGYKPVSNQFTTTHYMTAYKIIHMYYLKKSYDSLDKSRD